MAHLLVFDVLPPLIAVAVLLVFPALRPNAYDISAASFMWLISSLGVTAGFHRLFSHRSFCCGAGVKICLAVAGSLAAAGPVISWAATHRKHHQASDKEGDPHSPRLHGRGFMAAVRGFLHAQIGWLARYDFPSPLAHARDLLEDPAVAWVNRMYLRIVFCGIMLPALLSQLVYPGIHAFLSSLIWAGLVRITLVHQIISSVNSVCHMLGSRPFPTRDHSRNNGFLALLTVGESWHNNHHRHPSSAYIGLRWWEIDPGGWLVSFLRRTGMAWDVIDARKPAITTRQTP